MNDGELPIQQIDLMNQQLVAQSQQLEQVSQRYAEMLVAQQVVLQEVLRAHKTIHNHGQVIQNIMTFLHSADAKSRREGKVLFKTTTPTTNNGENSESTQLTPTSQTVTMPDEEASSPLQRASKLLRDLNAEVQFNVANLEQLHDLSSRASGAISTPPADGQARGVNGAPVSAESSTTMGFARLNNSALDQVVYPMGATNGIDPMFGEHVTQVPYALPLKEIDSADGRRTNVEGRKKMSYPGWSRSPQILLVEDDPTCRNIGSKFLDSLNCTVESAVRSDSLHTTLPPCPPRVLLLTCLA